jgi:hypothetical protein
MPPPDRSPDNRFRLFAPAFLMFGAIILLAIGAGSAVGIGYALRGPPSSSSHSRSSMPATGAAPKSAPPSTTAPMVASGASPAAGAGQSTSAQPSDPSPATGTGPPGDLVTQSVAQDVLATTWVGFAQSMVSDDRAALHTYTTPSALDDATATLDCGCLPGPMTYSTTAITTPPQSAYPLSFMAGLSGLGYNQVSQTWWVVFAKATASTPWVVAYFASYAVGGGLDGFTSSSAAPQVALRYPLQDAPQNYVGFFQKLDMTGDAGSGAPAGFAKNNFLDTEVRTTSGIHADRQAAGLQESFTHTVDQVSPIFAQVVDGSVYGAMECFSMKVTDTVTSSRGSPIVQPANQVAWGFRIAVGSYSSLHFTQEDDECVEESATSGVTLTSNSGGNYAISAIPST